MSECWCGRLDDEAVTQIVIGLERRLEDLKEFYNDRPADEQRRIRRAIRRIRRLLRVLD